MGSGAATKRALALRRLANRSKNEVSRAADGATTASHAGGQGLAILAAELLIGAVVSALVAALIVAFSMSTIPVDVLPPVLLPVPELNREPGTDLDPRDPLVLCTQFVTHTQCAREET